MTNVCEYMKISADNQADSMPQVIAAGSDTVALRKTIISCLTHGLPFALVQPAGERDMLFYCCAREYDAVDMKGEYGFVCARWGLGNDQHPIMIRAELSTDMVNDIAKGMARTPGCVSCRVQPSTRREEYMEGIRRLIDAFDDTFTKAVISRIMSVRSDAAPLDVAREYFNQFRSCYRAMYYTPTLGMWIVATPEILLSYDAVQKCLSTMSLAGTRGVGSTLWDRKNQMEHQTVTDSIASTLRSNGMVVRVHEAEELQFGEIEHLCNRITARGEVEPLQLAIELSPTPAVCGHPASQAFSAIADCEIHGRGCYGSFIGSVGPRYTQLYVNLRCCNVAPSDEGSWSYTLYGGGGINKLSNPDDEWMEADSKMEPLLAVVKRVTRHP